MYTDKYAHIHFFALPAERAWKKNLVETSIPDLGFNTILQLQVLFQGLLEELAGSSTGAGDTQMSLVNLIVLESKKVLKKTKQTFMDGECQRGAEARGQSWSNMNNKVYWDVNKSMK